MNGDAVHDVLRGVGELVELVASDLDDAALERVIADLSATAARADIQGVVSPILENCLVTRSQLRLARKRSLEFEALYHTTTDLAASRDIDSTLHGITARGKELLGTDVVYLLLVDDVVGDLYMRVSQGTVSSGFTSVRMAFDVGLVGLVAQLQAPCWTGDYLADDRFAHRVDDVVREEGIVSLLGVPLKTGGRLLGVLFAADRRSRSFSRDEISLLSLFATHAAIVLDNVEVNEETRDALSQTAAVTKALEEQNASLASSARLHGRLSRMVLDRCEAADLGEAIAEVVGCPVMLLDPEHGVLTRSTDHPVPDTLAHLSAGVRVPERMAALAVEALRAGEMVPGDVEGAAVWMHPVVVADRHLASLAVLAVAGHEPDPAVMATAATSTATLLTLQLARAEAENQVRGELLEEILTGPDVDLANAMRRARLLGTALEGPKFIIVVRPTGQVTIDAIRRTVAGFAREARGLVTIGRTHATLLVPGPDPLARGRQLFAGLGSAAAVAVGVAGPTESLAAVPTLAREAERCARAVEVLRRPEPVAGFDDLGVYGYLLDETRHDAALALIDRTLAPLRDYDERRGTHLLATLKAYFDHDGNAARAAASLYVHVNTFYQRVERLEHVAPGWRAGDRAMELRLVLGLQAILNPDAG